MKITLQVKNTGVVQQSLQRVTKTVPKFAKKHLHDVVEEARVKVATYPPKLPDQAYERTGRYGRGVKIKDITELQVELQTMAVEAQYRRAYHVYVGGDSKGQGQVIIHQNRWVVAYDAMEWAAHELVKRVDADIAKTLGHEGIGM